MFKNILKQKETFKNIFRKFGCPQGRLEWTDTSLPMRHSLLITSNSKNAQIAEVLKKVSAKCLQASGGLGKLFIISKHYCLAMV